MTYKPTKADLRWGRVLIAQLRDGGGWGWPDTGLVYRIDKSNKTLTLTDGNLTEGRNIEGHFRAHVVFEELGYEVLP